MLLSPLFLPSKKEKVPSCFSLQMKETLKNEQVQGRRSIED
jgi:hypothetical protein